MFSIFFFSWLWVGACQDTSSVCGLQCLARCHCLTSCHTNSAGQWEMQMGQEHAQRCSHLRGEELLRTKAVPRSSESYLHFNLTRKQKSLIRIGPLVDHHSSIQVLQRNQYPWNWRGRGGKFWINKQISLGWATKYGLKFQCYELLNHEKVYSALCSKACCHFKLNDIGQNEEQNTSQLINF